MIETGTASFDFMHDLLPNRATGISIRVESKEDSSGLL